MQFWIVAWDKIIGVDNVAVSEVDITPLPPNVNYFHFKTDCGEIHYDDRPSLPERILDPTPYIWIVDQFIAKLSVEVPPITLDQAKMVKNDLNDALYNAKRQATIVYLDDLWAATDEEILALTTAFSIGGFNSGQGQQSTLVNQINSNVVTNVQNLVTQINNTFAAGFHHTSVAAGGTESISVTALPGPGATAVGVGSAASDVQWYPLNSTTPVTLTFSQMSGLIQAINTRRNNLDLFRRQNRAAINALTTIADVIAFDLTTGWPTNGGSTTGIVATGGVKTTSGLYTIHTFNSYDSFQIGAGSGEVEYLVVPGGGGGGGGGSQGSGVGGSGGGGGGGGVRTGKITLGIGYYTIGVGKGGIGGPGWVTGGFPGYATNGGDSSFGDIVAKGGGAGGSGGNGAPGGSGGGGGGNHSGPTSGGNGTSGQGYAGGGNGSGGGVYQGAGGGGGCAQAGVTANSPGGAAGGAGLSSSISGTAKNYGGGGGGGGFASVPANGPGGAGGAGGGGAGAAYAGTSTGNGVAGTANTGGGGGGGAGGAATVSSHGGDGGSGVVILRYLTPTSREAD